MLYGYHALCQGFGLLAQHDMGSARYGHFTARQLVWPLPAGIKSTLSGCLCLTVLIFIYGLLELLFKHMRKAGYQQWRPLRFSITGKI